MIDTRYAKALGAAEATITYVEDMLILPELGEETMRDRRARMVVAIARGKAAIAAYLEPVEPVEVTSDCDCCGATVPRDQIAVVIAYGIETGACQACRGIEP